MDTVYISLGFSCQSRLTIDCCTASFGRMPFDWNITTKPFLLNALRRGPEAFDQIIERAEVYRMPNEGVEGVLIDGCYFWHDYHRNGLAVPNDWRGQCENITAKYRTLYSKFQAVAGNHRVKKIFVISNTQDNLSEFSFDDEDFARKFGIDPDFICDLASALDEAGVKNYEFRCMVRSIDEKARLVALEEGSRFRVEARYTGRMALPTVPVIALSTLLECSEHQFAAFEKLICRDYANGSYIARSGNRSFIAFKKESDEMWAEGRIFMEGLSFVFAPDGAKYKAVLTNSGILFSNRTHWDWVA